MHMIHRPEPQALRGWNVWIVRHGAGVPVKCPEPYGLSSPREQGASPTAKLTSSHRAMQSFPRAVF